MDSFIKFLGSLPVRELHDSYLKKQYNRKSGNRSRSKS